MRESILKVGSETVADPAAAITVVCGFVPRYVRVWNVNNLASYEFFSGMTAGTSLDNANHDSTQNSLNAAGSITLTANGFTMGTDICDTADDVIRYAAFA
jgi:hypothetical protein